MDTGDGHQDEIRPRSSSSPRLWPVYSNLIRIKRRIDAGCWLSDAEETLKEILQTHMKSLLITAIRKIMMVGYSKESAISSLLRFSLSYSKQDTISSVVDYGLVNLRGISSSSSSSGFTTFDDLEQLQNYILAEMVSVVKVVRPQISTADAMWDLLLNDLNMYESTLDFSPESLRQYQKSVENQSSPISSLITTVARKNEEEEDEIQEPDQQRYVPDEKELREQEMPSTSYSLSSGSPRTSRFGRLKGKKQKGNSSVKNSKKNIQKNVVEKQMDYRVCVRTFDFSKLGKLDLPKSDDREILKLQQRYDELDRMIEEWGKWGEERANQKISRLEVDQEELASLRKNMMTGGKEVEEPLKSRMDMTKSEIFKIIELRERWMDLIPRLRTKNFELREKIESAVKAKENKMTLEEAEKVEKEEMELQIELRKVTEKHWQIEQEISKMEDHCLRIEESFEEEQRKKKEAISESEKDKEDDREKIEKDWKRQEKELAEYMKRVEKRHERSIRKLNEEVKKMKRWASQANWTSPSSSSDSPEVREREREGGGKRRTKWECAKCRREEVGVVLVPCGHEELCAGCDGEGEDKGKCSWCGEEVVERVVVRFRDE